MSKYRKKAEFRYKTVGNNEISFIDDFAKDIEELYKSNDFSRNVDAIECMLSFIVDEAKSEEVCAIEIPEIGVLNLNRFLIKSKLKRVEDEERDFWKHRLSSLEVFRDEVNTNSHHFCRNPASYFSAQLPIEYHASNFKSMSKQIQNVYAAVENMQNESYKKELNYKP